MPKMKKKIEEEADFFFKKSIRMEHQLFVKS